MNDKEVICKNCNRIFVVRQAEQEVLSMRGRSVSVYCPICRQVYYAKKQEEQKQQENLEWQKKKEENARRYQEQLDLLQEQYSNVVPLKAVVPDPRDKVLYVIGNGFDLMHGAHSSYYDFEKTLGKHSYLRFILENYLEADDLWADFEGTLAKINVEAMSQPYILNDLLEAMVHMMRMHKPRIFLLQQKWQHHRLQSFPGSCDIDLSGGSIPCRCEQRIIR